MVLHKRQVTSLTCRYHSVTFRLYWSLALWARTDPHRQVTECELYPE
ncbi:hypothetical protein GGQ69_000669 [Micrococcus sp. TA1]|jgi:hypothetical protein|nr:hypothetical protein [Micrococcus sp. TA1]